MQGTKARRVSLLHDQKVRMRMNIHTYTYEKQCTHKYRLYIYAQYTYIYCIEYAYLLLTYLKNECRLYIAYIGTEEQKRRKV